MAHWYTYEIPNWEVELEELENEMELEHIVEAEYELELDKYEIWLFDQKMEFYDDLGNIGGPFTKFLYKTPSIFTEDMWCSPNFCCYDPMGLFYQYLDTKTFHTLMSNFFNMKKSCYYPQGQQEYDLEMLKSLFKFSKRWCSIHLLYDEENNDYNRKITLWVVSCIIKYLE